MDPMHITLGIGLVLAIAGIGWLLLERGKLVAARAGAEAERTAQRERATRAEAQLDEIEHAHDELEQRLAASTTEVATLTQKIEGEREAHRQAHEHQRKTIEDLNARAREVFENLAAKTLEHSSEQFLKRAQEAFKNHQEKADQTFDEKRKNFAELVSPIKEALTKTDERLTRLDEQRLKSDASLKQHLELLARQTTGLNDQTEKLVRSLKAPHVRGRWGELQLRRVVELAGMSAHCDFEEQVQTGADEEGNRLRPDMLVRLPGERCIVVDAKASLANYLEAIEAETDERRADRFKAHARDLRKRVDDLASKSYPARLKERDVTPDFTVLFVPGDQFLSAALLEAPDLLEHAASRGVILTTPATLIALLKAVSFGWAQATLEEDAREILHLGAELHDRLATLTEHLSGVGLNLRRSVNAFNKAVGSMEARVLPSARKIKDLAGVQSTKTIERQEQVLTEPKRLTTPEESEQSDQPMLIEGDGASGDARGDS